MASLNKTSYYYHPHNGIIGLVVCICACLFTGHAAAQYFTERKESGQCRINSVISGINEDSNGFIWLTSQDGVYRYDGNMVINYSRKYPHIFRTNRFGAILTVMPPGKWIIADEYGNLYAIDSLSNIKPMKMLTDCIRGVRNSARQVSAVRNTEDYVCSLLNLEKPYLIGRYTNHALYRYRYNIKAAPDSDVKQAVYYNGLVFALATQGPVVYTLPDVQKHRVRITGDMPESKDRPGMQLIASSPQGAPLLWYKSRLYEISGDTVWHTKLLAVSYESTAPAIVYFNRERQVMLQGFGSTGVKEYSYCQYQLRDAGRFAAPGSYYYSIIPDGNGFISVVPAAVFRSGVADSNTTVYIHNPLQQLNCYSVSRDKYNRIWYQSSADLFRFDTATRSPQIVMSARGNSFVGICSAKENDVLYIVMEHAVYKAGMKNGKEDITQVYAITDTKEEITTAFLANDHELWIGSNTRLVRVNPDNGKVLPVKGFDYTEVRTCYRLNDSTILLGTYNKGIALFKAGTFYFPDSFFSIPVGAANGFIADKKGKLWISTNNGLIRTDIHALLQFGHGRQATIPTEHFTGFDALASNEFNGSSSGSAVALSDSCFAFANAKGIILVNPLAYRTPVVPHNIIFEGSRLSDNTLTCRSGTTISLRLVVPYYGNRENLSISYRLGADGMEKTLSATQEIVLPELPPGTHYLYFSIHSPEAVIAYDNIITITVTPQWYQTIWFKTGIALLAVVLVWLGMKARLRYLHKMNQQLQHTVNERTGELQTMLKDLNIAVQKHALAEAGLRESNMLKEQYYSLLSHDLQSPVKYLALSIGMAKDRAHELAPEAMYTQLETCQQSAREIHNLIDKFTIWIRSNDSSLEIHASRIRISVLLRGLQTLYEPVYQTKGIDLVTVVDEHLEFCTDRTLLHIILRNSLDNALKHASHGTVTMRSECLSGGLLQIEVENTGAVISPEKLQQLNELQRDKAQKKFDHHRSLGFQIMALLTVKLGGQYEVMSGPVTGTTIRFIFHPLNAAP